MYRDQKRRPDGVRDPSTRGSRLRIGTILVVGAAAAFALWASAGKSGPRKPPPPEALGSLSAKRVTDHVADHGVVGGAIAAERAIAAKEGDAFKVAGRSSEKNFVVNVLPTPTPDGNPRAIRVTGIKSVDSHETAEAAKEDAILQAREKLREQLALLEPPIGRVPSAAMVREYYVYPGSLRLIEPTQADKEAWAAAHLDPNRVWATADLYVPEEGIRELRGESRLWEAARWGGILLVIVGALFGYLKLDGLSKGWLSVGLGVTAILAAGTLIAGLVFAL